MTKPGVLISVHWPDDWKQVRLTSRNWTRVRRGHPVQIRGSGYYYEGEFFWDYWLFSGGLEGELRVRYGRHGDGPDGDGWIGRLNQADIKEEQSQNMAVSPA